MLKIFHIISGDLWAGAAVQVFHTLVGLQKTNKITITCILFNDGDLKKNLENKGIETVLLDEKSYTSFQILKNIIEMIRSKNPDVIHVHAVKEHFLGILAIYLSLKLIPIIRTVHGITGVLKSSSITQYLRSSLVIFLDRFLISNGADVVIAVSKDMEQQLISNGVKGEILQLNNTIDLTCYQFMHHPKEIRAQYGVGDLFWIGTAARLAEPKNLQMLIETGNKLRKEKVPFRISIFGEGPLRESLQNLINIRSLQKHIVLHGFTHKIPDILRGLDVFVLCSIQEGLPMALLEAMALEKPVVCTAVGGMKEVIEDGCNCFNYRQGIALPSLLLNYEELAS